MIHIRGAQESHYETKALIDAITCARGAKDHCMLLCGEGLAACYVFSFVPYFIRPLHSSKEERRLYKCTEECVVQIWVRSSVGK
jgi:hypothetical protein